MKLACIITIMLCAVPYQQAVSAGTDAICAGGASGPGAASPQSTVLFVWAKTVDDVSSFPSWSTSMPTTLTDFYSVMSYNQHAIITKVATKNGGFFVSDSGHTVPYFKNLFQAGQGYEGPFAIFVEEMLQKVEAEYGSNYFDDVDMIVMMITDGGLGWYYAELPNRNYGGVGLLGVNYTTGNGKTFDSFTGGVNCEFAEGEKVTEFTVCHEYGHYLGLVDIPLIGIGCYSLMQNTKVNEPTEGAVPLSVLDVVNLGWLDMNDSTRVQTVTTDASVTLAPLRSQAGIVAAKIQHPQLGEYFLVANQQRSTNVYDGTYPADGLLVWHVSGINFDIECAVGLDPTIYGGFNYDHLSLSPSDSNFHGEGLSSDFFKPSGPDQFTPWTSTSTGFFGTHNGGGSNIAITGVTSSGTSVSFNAVFDFFSGTITADSWWDDLNASSFDGDVIVNAGATLTILPGIDLGFTLGSVLKIYGTLNVNGTATQPVTFNMANGGIHWTGIRFKNNSVGNVNWATISNANRGMWGDLSNNVTVNNCTIENFTEHGVYLNASSATIQNCTIHNGAGAAYGIYATGNNANPTLSNNTISNVPIGIGRAGSPGLATIAGNDISVCDDGLYMNNAGPNIYNNDVHECDNGIRLGPGCVPDIHDNDFYANNTGVYLEQSQPSRLRYNNFGWTGGSVTQGHTDPNLQEGVLVNYLTSDNVFLNNNRNNFYDGLYFDSHFNADIRNLTTVTLMAKRNYWIQQTVSGPLNANFPEANHNNNAGPTGGMGKTAPAAETATTALPASFALGQNFPNPFNPSTTIRFGLPEKAIIALGIYNLAGGMVAELVRAQVYEPGRFELTWDGRDQAGQPVSSGIYLYRLHAQSLEGSASFSQSRKLLVVR